MIWLNNQTYQPAHSSTKKSFLTHFSTEENSLLLQKQVQNAENTFREILLCPKEEFYYVSSFYCKESLFANFLTLLSPFVEDKGKNRLLLSSTAEESFISIFQYLQYYNFAYDWVSCNKEGIIEKQDFIEAISPSTLLFSLSLADGLLGSITPFENLSSIIKERKIIFHVDLSHYIKYLNVNKNLIKQVDIITFSGISLGGMPGSGGMFIRKSLLKYRNIFSNNEEISFPHVLAELNIHLAKEMSLYHHSLEQNNVEITHLRNYFENILVQQIPNTQILFKKNARLPNISTVVFNKIAAESLAFLLFNENITCNLGFNQFQPLSQALQSCGYSPLEAYCALSFAFDMSQDIYSIKNLVSVLNNMINKLIKQNKIF